jgi:type I restriction enzyme S subunit
MSRVPLSSVIRRTVGGGTPDRGNAEFWDGEIPWATVKDFKDASYKIAATKESISEKGLKLSASNLVPAGTPIICTRMAVGRIARPTLPVAINQDLRALFIHDAFDTNYVVRAIDSIRNRIENLSIGSTVKGISADQLLSFEIFSPPKPEQTKIAEVLSTVDRAIEQTGALIAKQQSFKTGLMQDLPTRGIDEYGNLRSEETHAFKDSSLGRIPVEWYVTTIGEQFERRVERGRPGLPIMSIVMKDGLVERSSVDRRVESNLSAEGHALVCEGDIAYNMMRMWQGVLGRASFDCLVSPAYVVLKPKASVDTRFAEWLFRDKRSILKFRRSSRGIVDDRLRLYAQDMFPIEFAFPESLDEQRRIAEVLDAHDARIRAEEAYRDKLKRQKKGLMQDLLTGKKRVTSLLEADDEQVSGSAP